MNRVRLNNNLIISQNSNIKPTQSLGAQKKSFQEILNGIEKNQEIKFSKHALERLRVRNIDLTNIEINKINGAIQQAEKKGVREALILMDDKAFIASVKNKTIITAASGEQLKENIFTNIDGAVIL